jgi:predicted transcriptional regulator
MLRKASFQYPSDVYAPSFEKFLTVSSVFSDSIVKGIIDDIVNTAVKTVEVDEQKQNIYNILLINMTQSCQIKQIYISLA